MPDNHDLAWYEKHAEPLTKTHADMMEAYIQSVCDPNLNKFAGNYGGVCIGKPIEEGDRD